MTSDGIRAYIKQQDGRQSLVLSDELDRDAMQASGRWIASTDVLEVRQ